MSGGQVVERAQPQQAVSTYGGRSLTAPEIRAQVNLLQDVMRSIMKENVHYGTIPGTQSKSLYKPGAEIIMSTFRLVCDPVIEDLSTPDEVRFRAKVWLSTMEGARLGAGIGECSSGEEKYAWRRPVCDEEFASVPENVRRVKWARGRGGAGYQQQQVRTNPTDLRNTVLKMAKKRGLIDAVLTVTAASDIFTQDIEDLPPEIAEEIASQHRGSDAQPTGRRAEPSDRPEYTDDQFKANKGEWETAIREGRTTADRLITKIEARYRMTDEQKKALRAVASTGQEVRS